METSFKKDIPEGREEEILADLKRIAVARLAMEADRIDRVGPDDLLAEVLRLDSMAQVVLALELEDRYGFSFEPEDMVRIRTVGDLVRIVRMRAFGE